ncbi:hypothetical protein DWUX_2648 [Desulfovibrio diazotrophicus]|nr:hypothetical protein DWUX_2648 [Desulfovibrio diazotrophicus]
MPVSLAIFARPRSPKRRTGPFAFLQKKSGNMFGAIAGEA